MLTTKKVTSLTSEVNEVTFFVVYGNLRKKSIFQWFPHFLLGGVSVKVKLTCVTYRLL